MAIALAECSATTNGQQVAVVAGYHHTASLIIGRSGRTAPASILHELVSYDNYEGMQFLIDRGIDLTIKDCRWGGTAAGWAYYVAHKGEIPVPQCATSMSMTWTL